MYTQACARRKTQRGSQGVPAGSLRAWRIGALGRTRQASLPFYLSLSYLSLISLISLSLSLSLLSLTCSCLSVSRWDAPLITGAWRKASPEPTSASEAATAMVTRRDGIFATAIGHPASAASPCATQRASARLRPPPSHARDPVRAAGPPAAHGAAHTGVLTHCAAPRPHVLYPCVSACAQSRRPHL